MKRIGAIVFALAGLWIAALMQRGLPLAPDEIEYFRATRWMAEGKTPYVDFWEHHMPLQWMLFAPISSFAGGPGVNAIVFMRWAQLPLWIAMFWIVVAFARRASVQRCGWWVALALLLSSATFLQRAIEYRVDVLGNLAFLGALFAIAFEAPPRRWIAFGALMAAAVLANMRLAPLVIFAGALALLWRPEERRWRWNPRALWMSVGIAVVALAFFAYLGATHSTRAFFEDAIGYNRLSANVLNVSTFGSALLTPFSALDLAGIAFWIAGVTGVFFTLRQMREPGPLQFAAVLVIAGVIVIAGMQVQYDYHFQNTWLMLFPFAALAIERLPQPRWRHLLVLAGVAALLIDVARTLSTFGAPMRYQNEIMMAADCVTRPDETVFDGAGFALRREPAWRYWFLTTGVRFLAAKRVISPYDAPQMAANPPAAIIADYRLVQYLVLFPRLRAYAMRHYVPLYRNLWVPGMTAMVGPETRRYMWTSPRDGEYDVIASDLLAKHPWFTRPFEYITTIGPRAAELEIPLRRLPADNASLQWIVDGKPVRATTLVLRKGSRVELIGSAPAPTGVLLVPHGITSLCIAPEEEIVF